MATEAYLQKLTTSGRSGLGQMRRRRCSSGSSRESVVMQARCVASATMARPDGNDRRGMARRDLRDHRRGRVRRCGALREPRGRSPELRQARAGRVVAADGSLLRRRRDLPRLRQRDGLPRRWLGRRRVRPGHPGPGPGPRAVPPFHGATHGHAARAAPGDHRRHHRDGAGRLVHRDDCLPLRVRGAPGREEGDARRGARRVPERDGRDAGRALSRPAHPWFGTAPARGATMS